jgi:drug/metabolite transporter (DMT)-like permease
VLAARVAALVLVSVAVLVLARRTEVHFPHGNARWLALAAGAFDVTATALLLVAVRQELVVVVAPIAALAPAFTVVLAWLLTGERLYGLQRAGLALALVGLVLVAAG